LILIETDVSVKYCFGEIVADLKKAILAAKKRAEPVSDSKKNFCLSPWDGE